MDLTNLEIYSRGHRGGERQGREVFADNNAFAWLTWLLATVYTNKKSMRPASSSSSSLLFLSWLLLGLLGGVLAFAALDVPTARHHHSRSSSPLPLSLLSSSTNTDFDYLETVREGIAEAGLSDDWDEAAAFLSDAAAIERREAEDSLARAWNWRGWAVVKSQIARRFIRPAPPDPRQLQTAIRWLREGPLAVPDTALVRGVREHPDVYLISPEEMYGKALEAAPEEYQSPDAFRETLLRTPSVLGCIYNCVDTGCNSNCGSCWVSFQTVNKQIKGE